MTRPQQNPTTSRGRRRRGSWRTVAPGVFELRLTNRDKATGRKKEVTERFFGADDDVERALTAFVARVDAGEHLGSDMTVGQLLERWYALGVDDWSPTTAHGYRRLIDRDLVPALGDRPIGKLRPHELTDYYRALVEGGLSAASVRRKHAVLRCAFNLAIEEGILGRNPAKASRPPKERRHKIDAPDPAAMQRAIKAGEGRTFEIAVFILLKAGTGARRGEVCALRWPDVDLDEGTLWIRRSIAQVPRQAPIEKDTKTHASRWIDLDTELVVPALRAWRAQQEARAAKVGTELRPDAFVFSPEIDGSRPYKPNHWTEVWRNLRKRHGVTGRLHDVRHFAATLMLASGVDIRTVAGRLGHAQPSTTLNIYADFVHAADRKAAKVLGSALTGSLDMSPDAKEPPALGAGGDDDDGLAGVPVAV
jgi:integrase